MSDEIKFVCELSKEDFEMLKQKKDELFSNENTTKHLLDKKFEELTGEEKYMLNIFIDKIKQEKMKIKIANVLNKYYTKKDLAEDIWKIQPYFYDKAKMWWIWKNYKWEMADEKDILLLVEDNSMANTIESKEKNEIIEAMSQYGRRKIPKPIKKSWIQFQDKIVDYITGEEFEATPEYFVTNPIPYRLHRERFINTPTMDKLFEEWVGKEYVQTLYEILAYCLVPDYPIHRLFCFIGSGSNGKSSYLKLLKKFIGLSNICSTDLDLLISSRFERAKLYRKLVCTLGETNFNELSRTSIIKSLTGQDLIGFEFKNKLPFDDVNYAKIIISTNNLPMTTDKTPGFYRRWLIIDFPNVFPEGPDPVDSIPEEEFECLAVKSLLILKDLIEKKKFTNEGDIEKRMEVYETKSNFLEKFIKEFTIEDHNGFIFVGDFNRKFLEWCRENRLRQMSETTIGSYMKKCGFEQQRKYFDWLYDGKGGVARVWAGLSWKDSIKNEENELEVQEIKMGGSISCGLDNLDRFDSKLHLDLHM